MAHVPHFIPGDPWVCCDRCGLDYRFSETIKEWTGLRVCRFCFEERHPQEYVRGIPDRRAVRDARPEPPDVFVPVVWSRDEQAEGWLGTCLSGAVVKYLSVGGFFAGWFTTPWFSDGTALYANSVNGQIYQTNPVPALGGYTVTATLAYGIDNPANTVTLKWQSADGGVWSAWTNYTAPFTAPFADMRFGIFVTKVSSYELWVDELTIQVAI